MPNASRETLQFGTMLGCRICMVSPGPRLWVLLPSAANTPEEMCQQVRVHAFLFLPASRWAVSAVQPQTALFMCLIPRPVPAPFPLSTGRFLSELNGLCCQCLCCQNHCAHLSKVCVRDQSLCLYSCPHAGAGHSNVGITGVMYDR